MTGSNDIENRLRCIEEREAVRALKAHYLACCDDKDTGGFRSCFIDGRLSIDYPNGHFDSADELLENFKTVALQEHLVFMHHGSNPRIEMTGSDNAHGLWNLYFQQIDTQNMTLTQL